MSDACVVCKATPAPIKLRYENRHYAFDREACKRVFQENPDRWLDAGGGVLEVPR